MSKTPCRLMAINAEFSMFSHPSKRHAFWPSWSLSRRIVIAPCSLFPARKSPPRACMPGSVSGADTTFGRTADTPRAAANASAKTLCLAGSNDTRNKFDEGVLREFSSHCPWCMVKLQCHSSRTGNSDSTGPQAHTQSGVSSRDELPGAAYEFERFAAQPSLVDKNFPPEHFSKLCLQLTNAIAGVRPTNRGSDGVSPR